jgi:hypothetical protein
MDPVSLIPELLKVANFFEVYHKTAFKCYRNAKNGAVQEVLVEIQDAGPAAGGSRYSCVATSEDGKVARGNPGPSIDVVLATVHWGELDE